MLAPKGAIEHWECVRQVVGQEVMLCVGVWARGRFEAIERRCGQPMRRTATPEGPQFASWLLRFPRGDLPADPTREAGGATVGVVAHVKGRFVHPSRDCVWEVEAEAGGSRAIELVQLLAAGEAVAVEALPESAKTLQLVRRTSPELFAQLVRAARPAS